MSWALAGCTSAASPKPVAAMTSTNLRMEAPERPKVIPIITANAARKRSAFGLGRDFHAAVAEKSQPLLGDEASLPGQSPQGDLRPGADVADDLGRGEAP